MASIEELFLAVLVSCCDCAIEFCINFFRHFCIILIEIVWPFVLVEVKVSKSLARTDEFLTDFSDSVHIHSHLNSEFLAENPYKLDCGCRRTSSEPPYVGIDDIYTFNNCSKHSGKTVTWSAVCVEINRHFERLFQFWHKSENSGRIHETGHVFKSDHLRTESFHLFCFLHKIFICEYLLWSGRGPPKSFAKNPFFLGASTGASLGSTV